MAQASFAFDDAGVAASPVTSGTPPQGPGRHGRHPLAATAWAATDDSEPDEAWQIGWEHARHGLVPPPAHLLPGHPVRQGWDAGRLCFRQRTRTANHAVHAWLSLRLSTWQQGRAFEPVQVTPHYLSQLMHGRCPVLRQAVNDGTPAAAVGMVDAVNSSAGVAAGNLAMLSTAAWAARANRRWDEARLMAGVAEAQPDGESEGLTSPQWARLAALLSYVTPLPHAVAAGIPMRVLPTNRLRLLNPIQGLQALITLQLTHADWSERAAQLATLLPETQTELRSDFHLFFHSLLPRAWDGGRPADARALRERLEDAWAQPQVIRRWQRFASRLNAEQAEQLVARAVKLGLAGKESMVQLHGAAQATEGWALETGGYGRSSVTRT